MSLSLKEARSLTDAAIKKADEIGQPMNIAVVDEGGNLLSFVRMKNAWIGSIDIAQGKAFSARAFDMPTKMLGLMAQPNQSLYGIEASNHHRVIIFAGGIPIERKGKIIGAIGVSGGTTDQDQEVAEAGVDALSR